MSTNMEDRLAAREFFDSSSIVSPLAEDILALADIFAQYRMDLTDAQTRIVDLEKALRSLLYDGPGDPDHVRSSAERTLRKRAP